MSAVLDVRIEVNKDGSIEINKLKNSADQAEKSTKNLTKSSDDFAVSMIKVARNVAVTVAGIYGISKAIDLAKDTAISFVSTSAQFEKYQTTLTSITGSIEESARSMSWITDFTAKTPFQLDQVTEAFVKMKAYGLDPMDGTLKTLGNTASAMGKDVIQAVEALADAVTGENERLKEFGVKASVSGSKVAYAWSDSSGKARNIVIDNNKDMIQSTLNAIFNEKYVGAMDAQSRTWDGMLSNIADRWTLFKKDFMDAGLFNYIKAIAMTVSDYLTSAFGSAKSGAKKFSDDMIDGIKSIIVGIGNMYDFYNGIKAVWASLKVAFFSLVVGVGEGVNAIAKGWDSLTVGMQNGFKAMVDTVGTAFYSVVNYILQKISYAVSEVGGALDGAFNFLEIDNPLKNVNLSIGEYVSGIQKATAKTEDLINLDWSKSGLDKASKDLNGLMDSLINEDGKKRALKAIDDIEANLKKVVSSEKSSNEEKEKARALLDKIGAGYGAVGDSSKSAEKNAKALAKEAKKAIDLKKEYYKLIGDKEKLFQIEVEETLKKFQKQGYTAEQLSDIYNGMWDEYIDGAKKADKETQKLHDTISDTVSNLANAYKNGGMEALGQEIGSMIVDGANAILPGLGTAIETIGALFSSTVTQAEIDASIGRVSFDDQSLDNLKSILENVQYPMLEVTNKISKHIRNMDSNFYSVARSLSAEASTGGIDLTGVNFVDTYKSSFLGFSSKSVSLIGTGLKFELETLGDLMDSATLSVRAYTTTLVQKSSFFGLKNSSKIKESYKNLPPEVVDQISGAFADGFEAILTAGVSLGLDKTNLSEILANSEINIGKVDFTGLSPDDVANRLSDIFSTALSGVVDNVAGFSGLIDRYAKNTEYSLETLVRIATEYDQASYALGLVGANFVEGIYQEVITETVTLEREVPGLFSRFFGGFNKSFYGSMESWGTKTNGLMGGIFRKFFTTTERYTEIITRTVDSVYTAQMQILDIVESVGGQTAFNDAMGAYMQNFFTQAEQVGFMTKTLEDSFSSLGLVMPKTNEDFKDLLNMLFSGGTEESAYLAGQVLRLSESFANMTRATESLTEAQTKAVGTLAKSISDVWTGSLSYLTLKQKAEYASGYFAIARESNGAINSVEASRLQAETALRTARTVEEYKPFFDAYAKEVRNAEKDATLSDVVAKLDELLEQVKSQEETERRTA